MTLVYSYGASAPVENEALVERQMRLAHRYRNQIVALERERRRRVSEAVASLAPEIEGLEFQIYDACRGLDALRCEIRRENSDKNMKAHMAGEGRAGRGPSPENKERAREIKETLKSLWAERKATRTRVFKSEAWKPLQAEIDGAREPLLKDGKPVIAMRTLRDGRRVPQVDADGKPKERKRSIDGWSQREFKTLRAESGLAGGAWGTYLQVEASMEDRHKGPPPNFMPWRDYRGKIAVQIQSGKGRIPTEEIAGGDDRLRLVLGDVTRPGTRRDKKLGDAMLWMLVDTAPIPKDRRTRGSRKRVETVWTKIPIHFHRKLPAGHEIKWAWLIRDRVGTHDQWKLQLTLEPSEGPALAGDPSVVEPRVDDRARDGVVGIDVGWRVMEDGSLRVAAWVGSDGDEGEIALPQSWLAGRARVDEIKSIRSTRLDEARTRLVSWLREHGTPEWIRASTVKRGADLPSSDQVVAWIERWRSPERFWTLILRWWANRSPGDAEILASLSTWRNMDRDLCNQECGRREKLQAWRKDLYRKAAALLRRRYGRARIESRRSDVEKKLDLRAFHELPEAEADERTPEDDAIVARAKDAACSILRECLEHSLGKDRVEFMEPSGTTYLCHACLSAQEWDRKNLMHECSDCGTSWDQDVNAARNLLEGVSDPPPARAAR